MFSQIITKLEIDINKLGLIFNQTKQSISGYLIPQAKYLPELSDAFNACQ